MESEFELFAMISNTKQEDETLHMNFQCSKRLIFIINISCFLRVLKETAKRRILTIVFNYLTSLFVKLNGAFLIVLSNYSLFHQLVSKDLIIYPSMFSELKL